MTSLTDHFEKHEEQAFVLKALLTVVVIIFLREYLSSFLSWLILFFPVLFLFYIKMQSAVTGDSPYKLLKQHITFIPVMHAENERKKEVIPWVTYSIVFFDIIVFFGFEMSPLLDPRFIIDNLVFLPNVPNLWNVPLSLFTAMFLHGSIGHLLGNMTFLWVVGTAVERRVGWKQFLKLYLLTGIVGGLVYILIEFLFHGSAGHALGASGAIAGIMGIFAVRCYFKSMIFPLPILGIFSLILPISLKIRLNSLVIIGLFFCFDLSGGIGQITGQNVSMVGHWAHLGGMITGFILAGFLKLGDDAVEERHLEIGIKASEALVGSGEGVRSLQMVLQKNPENVDALLSLARIRSKMRPTEEGKDFYTKAIGILAMSRPEEAARVFVEYYRKYMTGVEPSLLFRLAGVLHRSCDFEMASRCFEMLIDAKDTPPDLREKALFQGARVLEVMGHDEGANRYYLAYVTEFPHSDAAPKIREKLGLPMQAEALPKIPVSPPRAPVHQSGGESDGCKCPSCSRQMIRRRAANGPHAGKLFWVCAAFPECRQVVPLES